MSLTRDQLEKKLDQMEPVSATNAKAIYNDAMDRITDALIKQPMCSTGNTKPAFCGFMESDFSSLMDKLNDIAICKKATIDILEGMVKQFINDSKYRLKIFIALKKIEAEIIEITVNPLLRYGESDQLKLSREEMVDFLFSHFGVPALFNTNGLQRFFGESFLQEKIQVAAPFAVLEHLLQSGAGQNELALVNSLIKNKVLSLNSALIFKDGELHLPIENSDVPTISMTGFLSMKEVQNKIRNPSEFKILVGIMAGNIFEKLDNQISPTKSH